MVRREAIKDPFASGEANPEYEIAGFRAEGYYEFDESIGPGRSQAVAGALCLDVGLTNRNLTLTSVILSGSEEKR